MDSRPCPISSRPSWQAFGGEIRYRTGVAKILLRGSRATGVQTWEGEQILADVVISNADTKKTYFDLVGRENLSTKLAARVEAHRHSMSGISLHVGTTVDLGRLDLRYGTVFVHESWEDSTAYFDRATANQLSLDREPIHFGLQAPSLLSSRLAPAGKHIVHILVAPVSLQYQNGFGRVEGKGGEAYREVKRRLTEVLLRKAERIIPGLSSSVVVSEMATPFTFERYTGATGGAWYDGVSPVGDGFGQRRRLKTPIDGLYLTAPRQSAGRHAARHDRRRHDGAGRAARTLTAHGAQQRSRPSRVSARLPSSPRARAGASCPRPARPASGRVRAIHSADTCRLLMWLSLWCGRRDAGVLDLSGLAVILRAGGREPEDMGQTSRIGDLARAHGPSPVPRARRDRGPSARSARPGDGRQLSLRRRRTRLGRLSVEPGGDRADCHGRRRVRDPALPDHVRTRSPTEGRSTATAQPGLGLPGRHGLVIGVVDNTAVAQQLAHVRGWSGVGVWVVVFAVFIPSTPKRTLWVSTIVALADPLTLLVDHAFGRPLPPLVVMPELFVPR